jgi:polyphosphate kinase
MTRNLDQRSEVAVQIYDTESRSELKTILELQFRDNRKARIFGSLRENMYRDTLSTVSLNAQDAIYTYLEKKSKTRKAKKAN